MFMLLHCSVAVDLVSQKISYFDERSSMESSQCRRSLLDDYLLNPKLDLADVVGMACDLLITGIDTVHIICIIYVCSLIYFRFYCLHLDFNGVFGFLFVFSFPFHVHMALHLMRTTTPT